MLTLQATQQIISDKIDEINFIKPPELLYRPFEYVFGNGGKRIRPALTILSCNLFSESYEKAVKPAIGLELFHNFTLLHDDIMDKADVRRNKPTVHKKWNENVAILSGDAMLIEAYKMISKVDKEMLPEVLELFNTTALEVCEGQQYDMDFEERTDVVAEEYIEMIRLKTSVLIAACLKMGALIGGADKKSQDLLYDFGIQIGLGFQLKDDYLDSFGDAAVFGKKIGGDIVANKKTYLLIKALELANSQQKSDLLLLMNESFNPELKIQRVITIYKELQIDSLIKNQMLNYYNHATNNLDSLNISAEKKEELLQFAKGLINRNK
jgi:geranylgeranyl diphosphate synthase, type II